jgi:sulfite exporter TauE/SafE
MDWSCLHDLTALGPGGLAALAGALFLAGLAGGFTHCLGMCAPFVLAQGAARAERDLAGGALRRLSGAALAPYHAGRMLGYALLGAVAGLAAGLFATLPGLRVALAGLLLLAAVLMLAQGVQRLGVLLPAWAHLPPLPMPRALSRPVGALLAAPTGLRGVGLGLLLSALPCGLLYAALAAAAASGSALAGAIVMAAFAAGTVPALVLLALGGRVAMRGRPGWLALAGGALFALNGVALSAMALRLVG